MIIEKPLRIGTEISRLLSTSPKVVSIVGNHIYPYRTPKEIRRPHIIYRDIDVAFATTKDGEYPSEITLTLNCNTTDYDLGIELGEAVIDVFADHEDIAVTAASCDDESTADMFTHSITINIDLQ